MNDGVTAPATACSVATWTLARRDNGELTAGERRSRRVEEGEVPACPAAEVDDHGTLTGGQGKILQLDSLAKETAVAADLQQTSGSD